MKIYQEPFEISSLEINLTRSHYRTHPKQSPTTDMKCPSMVGPMIMDSISTFTIWKQVYVTIWKQSENSSLVVN